jgi:hypothetical protein
LFLPYVLVKENKKQLQTEINEGNEIEIKKQETTEETREYLKKQIKIYSDKHFENQIIVYSDIPESEKNQVEIFWINENRKVKEIDFLDTNNNGLYDRVSWVVPHLSEQYFEIIINFNVTGYSSLIEIEINSPFDNAEIGNPVEFDFNISYQDVENVSCELCVQGESSICEDFDVDSWNYVWSLPDGSYEWELHCEDKNNPEINTSTIKRNFQVDSEFYISDLRKIFLTGEEINFSINSKQASIHGNITFPDSSVISIPILQNFPYYFQHPGFSETGNYSIYLTSDYFHDTKTIKREFSVVKISIIPEKKSINKEQSIRIDVDVDSPEYKIGFVNLDFGDGTSHTFKQATNTNKLESYVEHTYNSAGTFTLNLVSIIGGESFSLKENGITVNETEDNLAPEITLIAPDDEEILNDNEITFVYKARDNVKLKNCTFELYNTTGAFGVLIKSKTETDVQNDELIEVIVSELKIGDYSWYVGCYDNSSNFLEKTWDFYIRELNETQEEEGEIEGEEQNLTLSATSETYFEQEEEIDELIGKINDFLIKEENFDADQKQVVQDLKISEDMDYYKKRLLQIKIDLGEGISFIRDETKREQRKQELIEEIANITKEVPSDIRVINKYEYVKNSINTDLKNIIEDYMKEKDETISNRELRGLTEINEKLQNLFSVSVAALQAEIIYEGANKEITIVSKKINLKNDPSETIIEFIPKEISDTAEKINFVTKSRIVKSDPIFEISVYDLEDSKIIYYLNEFIDLEKIEKTETILFKEAIMSSGLSITGFAVADLGEGSWVYFLIVILMIGILFYIATFVVQKIKINKWKEEEDFRRIYRLIKLCNKSLKEKDAEKAREGYHKIKEIYPLIPESSKSYVFKEINKILTSIDKRDVINLLKEYREAKKQGRKEDAKVLYNDINQIYKRLPKKYQEKVYQKLSLD